MRSMGGGFVEGGGPVLTFLSRLHGSVGRFRTGRRLLRRVGVRALGRAWLRQAVLEEERTRPNDVTVLIGVRDRDDHRLEVALRSLRAQTHPADLVRIVVVDYGSEPSSARRTAERCERFGATCLRVPDAPTWSRGRCLNVGLRRADTKFVLMSDADLVFSPRYLSDAIRVLEREPLAVVCSPMLDLPEESVGAVEEAAGAEGDLPLEEWRGWATPRSGWDFHPSIAMGCTAFYQLIRGYDEFYEVWGGEDDDLMRRLTNLGISARPLDTDSFYLHQWHPKFEGVDEDERRKQQSRKRAHLKSYHSILRNDGSWGIPPDGVHSTHTVAGR